MSQPIKRLIVVSDPHINSQLGLCPPGPIGVDEGGDYFPSKLQSIVWGWWEQFWGEWVPWAVEGKPFAVVLNGDALEGRHHKDVTMISQNKADQSKLALKVLEPIVALCEGRYYHIRGTEAHAGPNAEDEETLAAALGAIPNEVGQHARHELRIQIGSAVCHVMHHIGVTGSSHFETSAVLKEYTEACADSARWGYPAPNVVVRSHRHRHCAVRVPTEAGYGISFVTAGWQLKTPFAYRIAGGRVTTPQFGGSAVCQGNREFYDIHRTWSLDPPTTVTPATLDERS